MDTDNFLDLDFDAGEDPRVKFDGVTYTVTDPNLIQWDAIGKSLQKMSGLGAFVGEAVSSLVQDEKDDTGAFIRLLQNADSLWTKLFDVIGKDFFDGMADTCVAVLNTKANYLAWAAVHGGEDSDKYNQENKRRVWVGNSAFGDYLRGKLTLRITSSILSVAWQRSGVFDAMGKLLMRGQMRPQSPSQTET